MVTMHEATHEQLLKTYRRVPHQVHKPYTAEYHSVPSAKAVPQKSYRSVPQHRVPQRTKCKSRTAVYHSVPSANAVPQCTKLKKEAKQPSWMRNIYLLIYIYIFINSINNLNPTNNSTAIVAMCHCGAVRVPEPSAVRVLVHETV